MDTNRTLLAVLSAALVGGLLVVGAVAAIGLVRGDDPGSSLPSGVALRVDGIDVTFEELEIGRQLMLANDEVGDRIRQGDRMGLPEPMYELNRELFTLTAELHGRWPERVRVVAGRAIAGAIYAESVRLDVAPTDEAVASHVSMTTTMEEATREPSGPAHGYAAALFAAQRSRFDEQLYRYVVMPLSAHQSVAFVNLLQEAGLTPGDSGLLPIDLALAATIEVHPSLDVSADEVRAYLRDARALQLKCWRWPSSAVRRWADGLGFEQASDEAIPAP